MDNLVLMQQVHGNNICIVSSKDIGKTIPNCDGLISKDKKVKLGVRVADCLPISIKDQKKCVFGIFHAGWRGLDNRILEKAIDIFTTKFDSLPRDLKVKIGQHICVKHYEVGNEVAEKFLIYEYCVSKSKTRQFLDLARVAKSQLLKKGLVEKNIKVDTKCTFEDESLPSFRRDKTSERLLVTSA